MPPPGHDADVGPQLPPLRQEESHPPQPVSRPLHQSRDEPLHHLLPLRALLWRVRRRHRPLRPGRAPPHLLRPPPRRRARKRVQRQSRRGLPHRGFHRQGLQRKLHPQVGFADRALGLRRLRRWLQHRTRRALRRIAPRRQPLPQRTQWLLHLRPGPLRQRLCERPAAAENTAGWGGQCARSRCREESVAGNRGRWRRRDRHRLAPGRGRGQFRPAPARGRGKLLRRLLRRRIRLPGGDGRARARSGFPQSLDPRNRAGRLRARARRGCHQHRAANRPRPAPVGSQPGFRPCRGGADSALAGRRRARTRPARAQPAVHFRQRRHPPRRCGRATNHRCAFRPCPRRLRPRAADSRCRARRRRRWRRTRIHS